MNVSTTMMIGKDVVDITRPCDVAAALCKLQLKLASGALRETVRIDGEEVTFQRANDTRLQKLIDMYQRKCAAAQGRRQRFARRITFT